MNPELSFPQLGERMQDALGGKARRQYTALCLQEHFYQNMASKRRSHYARKWVKKYQALAREYPGLPTKSNRATQDINGEVETTHVATKFGAEMDWELGGDENAEKRRSIQQLVLAGPSPDKGQLQLKLARKGRLMRREAGV